MISKPRLRNVWPGSPLRPLVDDINRAILDQSGMTTGTGFGQVGSKVVRTSQDWMVAFTDANGIPAATLKDESDPSMGRKLGRGIAFEQTVEYDDNGDVWIVPSGPDDATRIDCFNYSHFASVPPNTFVEFQKRFGLWMTTWEECSGQ